MHITIRCLILTVSILLVLSPQVSLAEHFYINSGGDFPDDNLSDGECLTSVGVCTLRAAVMQANHYTDEDFIHDTTGRDITVRSPVVIASRITIYGAGSDGTGTNISGDDSETIFVLGVASQPTIDETILVIDGVRIHDGRPNFVVTDGASLTMTDCQIIDGIAALGGGIYAEDATISISDSLIDGNTGNDGGGGIYYSTNGGGGNLYLFNTTVSNNFSAGDGAGIHAIGAGEAVTLNGSRVVNNQTIGSGGGIYAQYVDLWLWSSTVAGNLASQGGGIYNWVGGARIEMSSIWGNTSGQLGGGILLRQQNIPTKIVNTTISGNTTLGSGGGIYVDTSEENWLGVEISSCTITGNTADSNTDDVGDGGGIFRLGEYEEVHWQNSILAGNHDLSTITYLPDCVGIISSHGYNVIGVLTPSCVLGGYDVGSQWGTVASPLDPGLGPRVDEAYNAYHRLLESSPTVDAGNPAGCTEWAWSGAPLLGNDQLGELRHQQGSCDVGSIESSFSRLKTLQISLAGHVSGTVLSTPTGIDCPGDCEESFELGTNVDLTPVLDDPYYHRFDGFTGDPDCSDGSVQMTEDLSCTATFNARPTHALTIDHQGTGSGLVVISAHIFEVQCNDDCTHDFVDGDLLPLTATPDPGSVFDGFGGHPDCTDGLVSVDGDKTCTAAFSLDATNLIFFDDFETGDTGAWSDTGP